MSHSQKQSPFTRKSKVKAPKLQDVQEFSLEMLELMNDDTMKEILYTYKKRTCKSCFGRGYQDIIPVGSTTMKRVPCACALKGKQKELEKARNKPIWGIKRGNAPMEFVYAKSKLPNETPTEGILHGAV